VSATSIREIARKRLEEKENSSSKTPRMGLSHFDPSRAKTSSTQDLLEVVGEDVHRFSYGQFQEVQGDSCIIALVSERGEYELEENSSEIRRLAQTLGLQCLELLAIHPKRKPVPATYLGSGTLEKIAETMAKRSITALIVDAPLSPAQVRNMEKILNRPVVDREGVILSIFSRHAQSALSQIQVELAYLKYLQPRLTGMWSGLSRQRGARGGLGGRGLGESRLELDRRVVKDRISSLTKKLKQAEKSLSVQSNKRSALPRVALVGYTNAGKSSLMQKLSGVEVEARNELFSTLDTTVKQMQPPTEPPILVSDTVGFVRDLPHDLVATFKTTLREASESRLLLHVLDGSATDWYEQFETTESVLQELGMNQDNRILVVNKMDKLGLRFRLRYAEIVRNLSKHPQYVSRVAVSAVTGEGLEVLKREIIRFCGVKIPDWLQS